MAEHSIKPNHSSIKDRRRGLLGLPPLPALLITAVYITAVLSLSRYNLSVIPGMMLYPVIIAESSGTDYGRLLRRLFPVLPLILLTGLSDVYLNREPACILGDITVTFGFISFITLLSKALLSVAALVLFSGAYSEEELAGALVSSGLPPVMAANFVLTVRYIGELKREACLMQTAWRARSSGRKITLHDAGPFLASFFIRCAERAKRTSRAMKCRGWSAESFTAPGRRIRRGELPAFIFLLAAALLPRVINVTEITEKLLAKTGL